MRNQLNRRFGMNVTYDRTWHGKEIASNELHEAVEATNPGSSVVIETDVTQRFKFQGILLAASTYNVEDKLYPVAFPPNELGCCLPPDSLHVALAEVESTVIPSSQAIRVLHYEESAVQTTLDMRELEKYTNNTSTNNCGLRFASSSFSLERQRWSPLSTCPPLPKPPTSPCLFQKMGNFPDQASTD
ncbi:hypothetical protein QJS10_CPB17g00915 [Acorus calamus]|uniref:Uncharacterized protein n=1 Tax=Acorus calamus TaxID=4465 RepID=A0AAV9CVL4_ACOCL|nr:hypothetical protein QJS10_CPB17g00915 [Acorus calamus]